MARPHYRLKFSSQKPSRTSVLVERSWWYENDHSIDIYVEDSLGTHVIRIERAGLADWIKRTTRQL